MFFVPAFRPYVKVDEGRKGGINSQHILEEENRLLKLINLNILNTLSFMQKSPISQQLEWEVDDTCLMYI